MRDLYEVLGVDRGAAPDVIKKSYRELAKKYHPDHNQGDAAMESKFKEISAAYHVLGDAEKRAKYDALRSRPGGFSGQGGMPEGVDLNDLFSGFSGFGGAGAGPGGMEDLLAELFGGAAPRGRGGPGGGQRVVYEFHGGGPPPGFAGGGQRAAQARGRGGPARGGPTEAPSQPESIEIINSSGSRFVRKGNDLHVDAPVSIVDAVLGGKLTVPTWTGSVALSIPAGTSSGQKMRLKGKGLEGGDQYVTIQITVPKNVSPEAAEHLRKFAALVDAPVPVDAR